MATKADKLARALLPVRQALQGASFGFADEAQDALATAIAGTFTDMSYSDAWKLARELSQKDIAQDWEEAPVTSFASQAVGGIPLGFTRAGQAATNWIRGGSALQGIGKGAAVGAGFGGAAGLGAADDTLGDRIGGLGLGATLGGLVGGATAPLARMGGGDVDYRKVTEKTAKGFDNKAQQELARQLAARPDLQEQLARAEGMALSSQNTGIPLTLAEALAQSPSDPLLAQQAVLGSNPMTAGRMAQMYSARSGTPQQAGQIESRLMEIARQLDPNVGSYDEAASAIIGKADESSRNITRQLVAEAEPFYKAAFGSADNAPLEAGNMRLYRGLEGEFDMNYPLSQSDAPHGYSTWTNNPNLAKQYAGKDGYVYYIDLPENKIGRELIDADGERSLFIANNKPAGIGGVSGDEYLVYNYHDDYSPEMVKPYGELKLLPDSESVLQNPLIQSVLQRVRNNPVYAQEMAGVPDNSIQALDAVKRSLDDMAENAARQGNRNEARLIQGARKELLSAMDTASPEYAQARQVYSGNSDALQMRERIGALADIDPMNARKVGQQLFSGTQQNADLAAQALGDRAPTAAATRIYGAMDELRNDPVNIASRIAPDQRTSDMLRSYAGSQYQPIEETLNVINQAKLGERMRYGSPTQPRMQAEQGLQDAASGALNAAVDVKTGGMSAIVRKAAQMLGRGNEQVDPQFYADMADLMLTPQGMDLVRRVASGQQTAIQELQTVGLPSLAMRGANQATSGFPIGTAAIGGMVAPTQQQSPVFLPQDQGLPQGFVIQNRPMQELPAGFVIQ